MFLSRQGTVTQLACPGCRERARFITVSDSEKPLVGVEILNLRNKSIRDKSPSDLYFPAEGAVPEGATLTIERTSSGPTRPARCTTITSSRGVALDSVVRAGLQRLGKGTTLLLVNLVPLAPGRVLTEPAWPGRSGLVWVTPGRVEFLASRPPGLSQRPSESTTSLPPTPPSRRCLTPTRTRVRVAPGRVWKVRPASPARGGACRARPPHRGKNRRPGGQGR
jgi:hypothetical protein